MTARRPELLSRMRYEAPGAPRRCRGCEETRLDVADLMEATAFAGIAPEGGAELLLPAVAPASTDALDAINLRHGKIVQGTLRCARERGKGRARRAAGTCYRGRNRWCTAAGKMNSGERFHGLGAKLKEEGRGEMEREAVALTSRKRQQQWRLNSRGIDGIRSGRKHPFPKMKNT